MSRYLSYLLRHGAFNEGLPIDSEGFVAVIVLLKFLTERGSHIDTLEKLQNIEANDLKHRFTLIQKDGEWFMRANQGHSIITVTEESLIPITDPSKYSEVVHGTFRKNLDSIKKSGLSKMKRNQIHFATSTDAKSGVRTGANVFIYVNLSLALKDGIKFFISDNNVILTPGNHRGFLEPKYFDKIIDITGNNLMLPSEGKIRCAGCIVFRTVHDTKEVCIVTTHKGAHRFPKGKCNKDESVMVRALRELHEETGITPNQISQLQSGKYVDEASGRNSSNISVRLFVTEVISDEITLLPKDTNEIAESRFLPVDKASTILTPKRQAVLKSALEL